MQAAKEEAEEQLVLEKQRVAEAMQAEQEAELEQRDAELVQIDSLRESQLSEAAHEAATGVCILFSIIFSHYTFICIAVDSCILLWIVASRWVSLCRTVH